MHPSRCGKVSKHWLIIDESHQTIVLVKKLGSTSESGMNPSAGTFISFYVFFKGQGSCMFTIF